MPHGGYIEGLMLGTVLLWLAVRLVRAREPWKKTVHYALLGFAGGVGMVDQSSRGLPDPRRGRLRRSARAALSNLEGRRPVGAGLLHRRRSVLLLLRPRSLLGRSEHGRRVRAAPMFPRACTCSFVERLPQYLDWDLSQAAVPFTHWLGALVYAWALAFFLWHLRGSFGARHPLRDAAIFPIFFLVFTLLFAASIHIRRNAPSMRSRCPPSSPWPSASAWCTRAGLEASRPGWVVPRSSWFMDGTTASWVVPTRLGPKRHARPCDPGP